MRQNVTRRNQNHSIKSAVRTQIRKVRKAVATGEVEVSEVEFRAGERRVIARLMNDPVHILATGGGAFLDTKTRELVREKGISIWLRASLDLLVDRVSRRTNRPLLKDGNQREILERLMEERYPTYEQADIVVDSGREPPEITADRVVGELQNYLAPKGVEAQDS